MSENINSTSRPMGPAVLYGIGALLILAGILWASVIGYYGSDVPWLIGLFAGGALSVTVARKWGERV